MLEKRVVKIVLDNESLSSAKTLDQSVDNFLSTKLNAKSEYRNYPASLRPSEGGRNFI